MQDTTLPGNGTYGSVSVLEQSGICMLWWVDVTLNT